MTTDVVRMVKLDGPLAARFGHTHRLAVDNVAEAVRALSVMLPGFEAFMMNAKDNGLVFAVFAGRKNLGEDNLKDTLEDDVQIRISPIPIGSKKNGVLQVIVGAVLIIVGVILVFTPFASLSPFLISTGSSLVTAGVVQLLMGTPKKPKTQDKSGNQDSEIFNGAVNTQAQGNPVPLVYGEFMCGSVVVSGGISAEDGYVIPTGPYSNGTGLGNGGGMWNNVMARFLNDSE